MQKTFAVATIYVFTIYYTYTPDKTIPFYFSDTLSSVYSFSSVIASDCAYLFSVKYFFCHHCFYQFWTRLFVDFTVYIACTFSFSFLPSVGDIGEGGDQVCSRCVYFGYYIPRYNHNFFIEYNVTPCWYVMDNWNTWKLQYNMEKQFIIYDKWFMV